MDMDMNANVNAISNANEISNANANGTPQPNQEPSARKQPFRIVPYQSEHAPSLAEMWNLSHASWGGNSIVETAEHVQAEHDASANLEEFIALNEADEAVGFCSFSKYFKDEGALYIPLLNVRPDWHGCKVGKALVLAAVKRTIEMGWPRLDLFTWPGNTKAVPTYKKCGFFWERRDDTTHLMNFIPTVLATDLLKPFFEKADWYADSVRSLEVCPDGREENGFHFYEYVWEQDGRCVRAEFERTARGLRAIETDDFLAVAEIDAHDLVAGCSYPVRYRFVSKTGSPLRVSVTGSGDGIIDFESRLEAVVTDTTVLEGTFSVGPLADPQDKMRTHPAVKAEISVNGQTAIFRMGIESKPPARVRLHVPQGEPLPGVSAVSWLEVENFFPEPADFRFVFPKSPILDLGQETVSLSLAPHERKLLPFRHTLLRCGFFDVQAEGTALLASKGEVRFTTRVTHVFKGVRGHFSGEDEESWFIANGPYSYHLQKNGGTGTLNGLGHDESLTRFRPPSLGKPWSNEFTVQRASRVEQEFHGEVAVQRAWFVSNDWPGLEVAAVVHLRANGEFSRNLKVANRSGVSLMRPLWVQDGVMHDIRQAVIPYDGTYLQISDSDEQSPEWFDFARVTENWIFTRGDRFTRGLSWHPDARAAFAGGIAFEYEISLPEPGGEQVTPATHLLCGLYSDWKDFRRHALRLFDSRPSPVTPDAVDTLEIGVNGGNPFLVTKMDLEIILQEHKNAELTGVFEARFDTPSGGQTSHVQPVEAIPVRHVAMYLPTPDLTGPASVCITVNRPDWSAVFRKHIFLFGSAPVTKTETVREGLSVLRAGNGRMTVEVAPDFSHALSSMKVDDREWMDSSFPTPAPRSWWGSWPGGIATKPWDLQHSTLHEGARSAAFADLTDNRGNAWSGLSTTVTVGEHPKFKNLTLTQYFLLLPGIPVLAHVTKVGNGTGTFFNMEALGCECFLKGSGNILADWFAGNDFSGNERRYRSGLVRHEIEVPDRLYFGSDEAAGILQPAADNRHGPHTGMANVAVTSYMKTLCVTVADGDEAFTDPVFLLAGDKPIPSSELADLLRIRF